MVVVPHTEINGLIGYILSVFLIGIGVILIADRNKLKKIKSHFAAIGGICFISLGIGVLLLGAVPSSETISENPINVKKEIGFFRPQINQEILSDKISKAIETKDIKFTKKDNSLFYYLHKGEPVDFTATKNGSEIYGKVKFTKTEMIVTVLNSESDNFKVSVK